MDIYTFITFLKPILIIIFGYVLGAGSSYMLFDYTVNENKLKNTMYYFKYGWIKYPICIAYLLTDKKKFNEFFEE